MNSISRKLVLLFAIIFWQSSLGTKSAQINAQNLGQNGYRKYEDGLLIQWGVNVTGVQGERITYFLLSFSDTNYSIILSSDPGGKSIANSLVSPLLISKASSNFKACNRYYDSYSYGYGTLNFYWIAIGKWK